MNVTIRAHRGDCPLIDDVALLTHALIRSIVAIDDEAIACHSYLGVVREDLRATLARVFGEVLADALIAVGARKR